MMLQSTMSVRRIAGAALLAVVVGMSGCGEPSTDDAHQLVPVERGPDAPKQAVAQVGASSALQHQADCWIDPLILLKMLREQQFANAESRLQSLQSRIQQGACSDYWLRLALQAFENTDPEIGQALENWVASSSRSPYAYAARGSHFYQKAWHIRGSGYANKTAKAQLEGMERTLVQASADLREAIRLEPKLAPAYALLIDLAAASSGPLQELPIFERGTLVAPLSYSIHRAALRRLSPKWGGSVKAVNHYLSEIRPLNEQEPVLAELQGYALYAEADLLGDQRKFEAALSKLDQALAHGPLDLAEEQRALALGSLGRAEDAERHWRALLDRHVRQRQAWFALGMRAQKANAHEQAASAFKHALAYDGGETRTLKALAHSLVALKRVDEAVAALERAATVAPYRADIASQQAKLLYDLKRNTEALAASDRAMELRDDDANAWRDRGLILLRLKRAEEAISAFDRGLALAPNSANLHFSRGWAHEFFLKNPDAALADYRKATERSPNWAESWYALARSAYHAKQCDVVVAAEHYVALCRSGRCKSQPADRVDWAQRQLDDGRYKQRCPAEWQDVSS